jgi:hypothetical protein
MELLTQLFQLLQQLIEYVMHMDQYLNQAVIYFGPWSYAIFFMVIFCETGLVVKSSQGNSYPFQSPRDFRGQI